MGQIVSYESAKRILNDIDPSRQLYGILMAGAENYLYARKIFETTRNCTEPSPGMIDDLDGRYQAFLENLKIINGTLESRSNSLIPTNPLNVHKLLESIAKMPKDERTNKQNLDLMFI